MQARWAGALAVAALAASAGARAAGGSCDLARVDRRTATSAACTACHGPIASAALTHGPGGHPLGHPVEVDYAAAVAAQPDRFAPPASLPPEVPLVAGKIECTTCHDGASRDPRRLVAATRVLCLACHRL